MFCSGKLTVTISWGSIELLAGLQLSDPTIAGGAAWIAGAPDPKGQQRYCLRETSSWTQPTVPTSMAAVSATLSFHVPLEGLPFRPDKGCSGRNVPAKGAAPAEIAVAAESSKTVWVPEQSFEPVP